MTDLTSSEANFFYRSAFQPQQRYGDLIKPKLGVILEIRNSVHYKKENTHV